MFQGSHCPRRGRGGAGQPLRGQFTSVPRARGGRPQQCLPPPQGWPGPESCHRTGLAWDKVATQGHGAWAVVDRPHFLFISPLVSWSPTCTPRGSGHGKCPACPGPAPHTPQGQAPAGLSGRPLHQRRCRQGLGSCSSPRSPVPTPPGLGGRHSLITTLPTTWKQPRPRSSSSSRPLASPRGREAAPWSVSPCPVPCGPVPLAMGLARSGLRLCVLLVRCLQLWPPATRGGGASGPDPCDPLRFR